MSIEKWPFKDPDEDLDYDIKWGPRIDQDNNETIVTSTWDIPSGVTTHDQAINNSYLIDGGPRTKIWIAGGTIGQTYEFTNHVATSAGRYMDKSAKLKIKVK